MGFTFGKTEIIDEGKPQDDPEKFGERQKQKIYEIMSSDQSISLDGVGEAEARELSASEDALTANFARDIRGSLEATFQKAAAAEAAQRARR